MTNYKVQKNDGRTEVFDSEKILNHIKYATDGLQGCSPYEIFGNLKIKLNPVMKSSEIQQSAIYTAVDMINPEVPDSQYVPARLLLQDLYKKIYGSYNPVFNADILENRCNIGYYDKEIFNYYTKNEINELAEIIDFSNDYKFTYLGLSQLMNKYSIKRKGLSVETPQEIFFLIPLYVFARVKNSKKRKKLVKKFYKLLASFDIFLPTPHMVGIRTNMKGFTSCAGIDFGNSIESFGNASKSLYKLITKLRAGIGMNPGKISGLGAEIMSGAEKHTGIVPYLQANEKISRSSTQPNSGRSGAITNYYPFFHIEIEDILQLKNNKGSEETSVRHSDHAIVMDPLVRERINKDEDISLFYMNDVGELYEIIGTPRFKEEYLKYEKLAEEGKIYSKKIKATSLEDRYFNERYITARNYKVNAKPMQEHSAFKLPTYISNLCLEINLSSFPDEDHILNIEFSRHDEYAQFVEGLYLSGTWYQLYRFIYYKIIDDQNAEIVHHHQSFLNDPDSKENKKNQYKLNFGEIFSCILGGVNFGSLSINQEKRKKQLKERMYYMVYFLDELIDYQDYQNIVPFEKFTKNRRALGISPGNYFYFLAKNNYNYDTPEARAITAIIFEEFLFYGLKASNELAKEKGHCKYYKDTKYSDNLLPIDTYERNVDRLYDLSYVSDNAISQEEWNQLREDIKIHGLRNSTLLTAVPSSNSSRPGNMISGINPPQGVSYSIEDNNMKITAILPNSKKFKQFYEYNTAWNLDIIEYWKLIAIMQKYIDQSISTNEYVDFTKYEDNKLPKSEAIRRDVFTEIYGMKTLYYAKTKTDVNKNDETNSEETEGCSGGGCTL